MEGSAVVTAGGLIAAEPLVPATAPALGEAVASLLAASAPRAGALAGAVGTCTPPLVDAAWNCDRAHLQKLLAREDFSRRLNAASGSLVPLDPGAVCGSPHEAEVGMLRALPLQTARDRADLLLLLYPAGFEPSAAHDDGETTVVSLITLLLDREFFASEARRAREAREHFLVAIHHELRTPATALMLEAGLLQTGLLGTLPPRLQQSLHRLEGQVTDLVRVVQRVLDLAQLETAHIPPRDDLFDPRESIVTIARHVEPAAERRGVSLSLFFPRALPLLQTDEDRFRRVLLYLMANALKYSERGHIQVRVERCTHVGTGQRHEHLLVVRVVDSGRGIPPDELERVFEPFAQVEEGARTDSHQRGVGLGLPLARKLARSIGGDVTVQSAVGKGTTASFSVPYRAVPCA
jgi:signal transduction histidine kinase